MCRAALTAADAAYAPYSHFAVGAAVATASGAVFVGSNLENASYGMTICAEAAALAAANTAGERELQTVAIVGLPTSGHSQKSGPITPCGRCRQMIAEFTKPDADVRILCCDSGLDTVLETTISELLPYAFARLSLPD
ncbi:cytidine deaminase [Amorphus sp. 3PC139-8]